MLLDYFPKDSQDIKTNWLTVTLFGIFFLVYNELKFYILGQVLSFGLVFIIIAILSLSIELGIILLFLRKKYLSSSTKDSFLTSYLYCTLAYGLLLVRSFVEANDAFPDIWKLGTIIMTVIIVSTPSIIVGIMLANYITANYLNKKQL